MTDIKLPDPLSATADAINSALTIGGKLLDHFFPDPAQRAEAAYKLLALQQSGELAAIAAQADVNKIEAASPNWFVAGWRPFIGWICGAGLAMQFLIRPVALFVAALLKHSVVDFPSLDTGTLLTLLFGMLGLGAMRTAEKLQDAAGNH